MKFKKVVFCSLGCLLGSSIGVQAKICFLPDCEKELEESQDAGRRDTEICRSEGFVRQSISACPPNTLTKACSVAPDKYFSCDARGWCLSNGFTISADTCSKPAYPQDKCPSFDLYKSCLKDVSRACQEINPDYTNRCAEGWRVDGNQTCPFDETYGICCNLCTGYTATSKIAPVGYEIKGSCQGCDGERYKLEALPCPEGYSTAVTSCRSGYNFSTNGNSGTQRCGKCTASGPVCPEGYTSDVPTNYGHRGDLAVYNGNKTAWCFPKGSVFYDAALAGIGKRQSSIYQIRGNYTFSNYPYMGEIEYSNGSVINGDVSFSNIYSFGGTLTFSGKVWVLGKIYLASGAKVCFPGGVTFLSEYEPACDWRGWNTDGSTCRFSGNCYY